MKFPGKPARSDLLELDSAVFVREGRMEQVENQIREVGRTFHGTQVDRDVSVLKVNLGFHAKVRGLLVPRDGHVDPTAFLGPVVCHH